LNDTSPRARAARLVIKELAGEVLVYDLTRDKAHCLNASAAAIWKRCDGRTSTKEIAASLTKEVGETVDEGVVWLALAALQRSHLLEDVGVWPTQMIAAKGLSRREAVRRIGLGAVIAVPLVISITAPTAVQAISCGARCKPCGTAAECCSGVCASDPVGCGSGMLCT
jgi:hypothetical protein